MQLEVKAQKLYALIVTDLALSIGDTNDLSSLLNYINEWKLTIWETTFFKEFKSKDGIQQSKAW
jgi:hypothetical protein